MCISDYVHIYDKNKCDVEGTIKRNHYVYWYADIHTQMNTIKQ